MGDEGEHVRDVVRMQAFLPTLDPQRVAPSDVAAHTDEPLHLILPLQHLCHLPTLCQRGLDFRALPSRCGFIQDHIFRPRALLPVLQVALLNRSRRLAGSQQEAKDDCLGCWIVLKVVEDDEILDIKQN